MASQIEELPPIVMGKGCHMRAFIDHSKKESESGWNWSDITYDGAQDSFVLAVPNHWHRYHDEIVEVLEGKMTLFADLKEITLSAGDAPLFLPRGQVHGFTVIKGQRVRFIEKTQPTGTFKAAFFQDVFQQGKGMPGFWMYMRACYDGDTFPNLAGNLGKWIGMDWLYITVVGLLAKGFVPSKPATLRKKVE